MNEPLIISQDTAMLNLVQSSAAAAGIGVQHCETSAQVRRAWTGAPLILVGVDQAASVAGWGLPERTGVHVVGTDADAVLAWSVPLAAPGLVLPRQAGFLASLLDDAHRPSAASGAVLRFFGATGGLGTSTLAMGLAMRVARRGRRVALVELDPAGGGLDVMAGAEGEAGWRWGDLTAARGHVDDLTGHLPAVLGVDIVAASRALGGRHEHAPNWPKSTWAGPGDTGPGDIGSGDTGAGRGLGEEPPGEDESDAQAASHGASSAVAPPQAISAVLAALRRTHDLVVIDQGRVPPAHEETVLVVGADVRSVLAAQVILANGLTAARAVIRTGPGRRLPLDLIAESLDITVAGVFPHDSRLPAALEAGDPPGRANDKTSRALDKLADHLTPDRHEPAERGWRSERNRPRTHRDMASLKSGRP